MLKVEYIVNSIFDSITWLLFETESNQVWLVDCGDMAPIINIIGNNQIAGVLLTHAHFDHIYGLPELFNLFPECILYTNEVGRVTLANAKLNMSFYHETPLIVEGKQICICGEGDKLTLYEGVEAIVHETPGHHPSCITFEVGNYLFTGDAYIPKVKVVTNLPKGDRNLAYNSIEKIIKLAEGKILFPGHFTGDKKRDKDESN